MTKQTYLRLIIVGAVVLVAVAWRLFADSLFGVAPNFTPVLAMAIFAGAILSGKRWLAYLLPLGVMLISDIFIGFHETMPAVYLGLALAVYLGYVIRKRMSAMNVVLAGLAGSLAFFVISNFGVWVTGMVGYPMTLAGLGECYVQAIPFFRHLLAGTMIFSLVFFGSFYLIRRQVPALAS